MARSYQDVTAARRERLSPDSKAQREVFEQAYDTAVRIIELRERHGLTQTELDAPDRTHPPAHRRGA